MLSPFLPVDVYARSGPVTDSVNVSNQDQDFVFRGRAGIGTEAMASQTVNIFLCCCCSFTDSSTDLDSE